MSLMAPAPLLHKRDCSHSFNHAGAEVAFQVAQSLPLPLPHDSTGSEWISRSKIP